MMAFRLPEHETSRDAVITLHGSVLTAAEEQKKWLQEALNAVDQKAAVMQAHIEEGHEDGDRVIKAAARVLDELRTNLLEPHNYYELYMKVFGVMESFVAYLEDEYRAGRHTLEEMYERVQFSGFIVPRLYLLIAAGSVYIDLGDEPALEIVRDLVEMCKGVQHPTRGLFLRHFLLTMMKGKLPGDPGRPTRTPGDAAVAATSPTEAGAKGTVTDTAHILVQNLKEMNWLWIRMEAGSYTNRNGGSTHSVAPAPAAGSASTAAPSSPVADAPASPNTSDGSVLAGSAQRSLRSAQRTQQERRALCVLVGMNVVRIAQLDGLTRDVYVNTVLPQLLSVMVRYREPLAQQYLFEILIQVFPDELHLFTVDKLCDALSRAVTGVDVPELLRSLMERLCRYTLAVQDGRAEVSSPAEEEMLRDVFPTLLTHIAAMPVSYQSSVITLATIKRTASVPPPAPMLLGAYITTLRHLVDVVLALYSKSVKRRLASLSSIVAVVASKCTAATTGSHGATEEEKDGAPVTDVSLTPAAAQAACQLLLHIITKGCTSVQEVLNMEGMSVLVSCLPFGQRRRVAMAVCTVALRGSTAAPLMPSVTSTATNGSLASLRSQAVVAVLPPRPHFITTLDDVAHLFELLGPILGEQPDAPSDSALVYPYNPATEFMEEQNLVCRVLHLLSHDDPVVYSKMLTGARHLLLQGGARRLPLTCPTLITLHQRAALRLYAHYRRASPATDGDGAAAENDSEAGGATAATQTLQRSLRRCLGHLYAGDSKGILEVYSVEAPAEAAMAYLSCAATADACNEAAICYELCAEALTLYESNYVDAPDQIEALIAFVNALYSMRSMTEENYEVLAAKVCQYASKLLKKRDQSRLVAICANLFAKKELSRENQQRVQECLRRSLKLAGQVLALSQLQLYVQLLNIFLHFFTSKSGYMVTTELVNELVERIAEVSEEQRGMIGGEGSEKSTGHPSAESTFEEVRLVYRNTTRYVRSRQAVEERWKEVDV